MSVTHSHTHTPDVCVCLGGRCSRKYLRIDSRPVRCQPILCSDGVAGSKMEHGPSAECDECIFDDKKIKFNQKLPRPLSLDNYEVALTEFTSTALNDPEGNLCIKRFIGDYVDFTEMNKTIFVPINLEIESEAIINENIKNHLAVYLYYFYQHLFYNPDEINARGIAKNCSDSAISYKTHLSFSDSS